MVIQPKSLLVDTYPQENQTLKPLDDFLLTSHKNGLLQ